MMKKPSMAWNVPECPDLISTCQDYLDYIESSKYNSNKASDHENAIFEAALRAVFGEDVFDFVNWKSDERDKKWMETQKVKDLINARKIAESMGLKIVPKEGP